MNVLISRSLFVFCGLLPGLSAAQPMVVLGGGQVAQECFKNAEYAAKNLPGVGKHLLEPCDYSLEYSPLSLRDRAATYANRGIVYAALHDYDAAMDDYEAAIAIRPSSPEVYVNRGNAFFMIREYNRAMDDYEQSIGLGIEQLHFVHYNMGMTFERLGNDKAAEREYLKALEFDASWTLPENRLAIVRDRMAGEGGGTQRP